MKKLTRLCLPFLCTLAFSVSPVSAEAQDKPSLLVLGSAHFDNPGRDSINMDVGDVMSDRRQQELDVLIQQLAEFRPTRIAIEVSARNQANLDQRYQDYREGRYKLGRSEADQIGLRLAAALGHERVYAVDWNGNPPGDVEKDYDWHRYGQSHGHEAAVAAITSPERAKAFYVELKDQTISQWLLQLNSAAALQASHGLYFDIAMIGDGDELIGANWVGTWYARNLKIYSRLVDLAQTPEDRVLVVYGQGHAYLLQQFAREHAVFTVTSVDDVLKD